MNTRRLIQHFLALVAKQQIPLYCDREGNPFIELPIDPQKRPWPLRSKTVRSWVFTECFQGLAFVPTPGAVDALLNILGGHAWQNIRNDHDSDANDACTITADHALSIEEINKRKVTLS